MPAENRSSNTEQMVSELLTCPFCKAAMRIESNRDWHRVMGDHDEECVFLDPETMMVPATDEQRDLIVRDWNRRAQLAAMHQGVLLGWVHGEGQEFTACPNHAHDLRAEGIDLTPVYSHGQHPGEPVALPAAREPVRAWGHDMGGNYEEGQAFGWNACLDEIAKQGPLYTNPDAGEVERLRDELAGTVAECQRRRNSCADLIEERDTLRAQLAESNAAHEAAAQHQGALNTRIYQLESQLAERDSLLRHIYNLEPLAAETSRRIEAALSASVEPVADRKETHDEMRIRHKREFDAFVGDGFHYEECRCGTRGSYPAEVKHCVCGKPFASAEQGVKS